ncbi:Hsp70 family protein [Microlunatus capsulatus]|uniref:Molecular chaperone DnaK n=1 Tax=Microlunatus capsulatus TaxID=99117 RepID=A0ABS4ZAC7_9ACTN|nr:Hsp70 family protein [Microlunatus capsulatus]MBP2417193.1 molecular chaperone DnaK [Microlunatus capsulatus]
MSEKPVLGIDLGTTYSCVAQLDDTGRVTVLPNSDGDFTTPSVVFFEDSGNVVVGELAKKETETNADRVVSLIKRHMGEDGYTVTVGDQVLYPQAVSAIILRFVVEDALTELGLDKPAQGEIADVVITVPAYFGAAERSATRDAGKIAGLNVVNIINEPTAAAIAYGVTNAGTDRTVLVYDLGGGTFDVTVIKVSENSIRVIATGGDHSLGGADWDERIADMLAEEFVAQYPDKDDPRADLDSGSPLEVMAEDVKKSLSRKESATVTVIAHGERAKIELTRSAVLERTDDLVARTVDFTRQVLDAAAAKGVDHIDDLLLVGGMSRFPVIAQRLAADFKELPEPRLTDPDQIVAKGAALFAAREVAELDDNEVGADPSRSRLLPGGEDLEIINVTSKGYGIKVVKDQHDKVGHIEWLIHPNDELPTSPSDTFHTVMANQTEVHIEIYESTTDILSDVLTEHVLLVDGDLAGLPSGKPANQPIQVNYNLGDDGILRATANSGGRELKIEAKISGATPQEVLDAPLPYIQR